MAEPAYRTRAGTVAALAGQRAEKLVALQSECIDDLKESGKIINQLSDAYKSAYKGYIWTLHQADEVLERSETASGIVKDIVIGTAISMVNPAAAVAAVAGRRSARAARAVLGTYSVKQRVHAKSKDAVDGFINSTAGWVAGEITARSAEMPRPSATAGLGGRSIVEQFEADINRLDGLIQALPNLLPLQQMQQELVKLARVAQQSDDPELHRYVVRLDEISKALVDYLTSELVQPFNKLTDEIATLKRWNAESIRRQLWIEWASRLSAPHDELNYKAVRKEMLDCGLTHLFSGARAPMTGEYSGEQIPDQDRRKISKNARAQWLRSRGVRVDDELADQTFAMALARDVVEKQVSGQRGVLRRSKAGITVRNEFNAYWAKLMNKEANVYSTGTTIGVQVDSTTYMTPYEYPARGRNGDAVEVVGVRPSWADLQGGKHPGIYVMVEYRLTR